MHGSADWLAAGARGDDDDDDSAARRAKTRNEGL
jgi:Meckel syndrome type 1 protein